ncbi:MAG: DNA photolyase family protein [Desulfuromonadales bacterium]|nr:DNA photolyase family protein [Desulfuromonadales bacterium]
MIDTPVIFWFRQDLRLADNPGLTAAAQQGAVIPVYILDDEESGHWRMGSASRWWAHRSLHQLEQQLQGRLLFFSGKAEDILQRLTRAVGAEKVFWNRCYEPWRIARDRRIKETLNQTGIGVQSFNASLLWEPWEVLKGDATPYKVFTPYYRKGCLGRTVPRPPLEQAPALHFYSATNISGGCPLAALALLPSQPWHKKLEQHWQPGEKGAHQRLNDFIAGGLDGYRQGRDFPALEQTSRLSPHLHFGEISPHQIRQALLTAAATENIPEADLDHFFSELAWREFSYYQLYHNPHLPESPLRAEFQRFPWLKDEGGLRSWQGGLTGYPLVDAGMRELWQTGFMHNRVRMVVGSFLVKNLMLPWQQGESWFWDCLVDADLASNAASWQWVAGCGADAAPYFRIFNPVTQGQKFDSHGDYVRRYIPEIAALPDKYLHAPWTAPIALLEQANIVLGRDYPLPLVDLKASRQRALDAYQQMRHSG